MTDFTQTDTDANPMAEIETQPSEDAPTPPSSHGHKEGVAALSLAALGVVFGDIGTSPLYSLQTVFAINHGAVKPTEDNIFGVISLVFWAIMIIVSFKYITFVMRADNDGEGGILALVALLRDRFYGTRAAGIALVLGIIGAGLFYGDSVITPSISVMSAIEGLHVINPEFERMVLPLSVVVLSALFMVQRWGTAKVGGAFGPLMVIWFGTLAAMGIPHILDNPRILLAVSPHFALSFAVAHPWIFFLTMGAAVLTITGAEALYADMGHFGARPIRLAWFFIVLPALVLTYMGQGAMLLKHPENIDNPFFRTAPGWFIVPLVFMATAATVIASQAVISGAFSVSRQASRLRLLPRLSVRHTSKLHGGQIYIPSINWTLFVGVLMLISIFQSSTRLASAYGLAVTGTEILTTVTFLIFAKKVWKWPTAAIVAFAAIVSTLELLIFSANLLKFFSGGWIPIVVALLVIVLMTTWYRGVSIILRRREIVEGPLEEFVEKINNRAVPIQRVPGFAVFPHRSRETTPLALKGNLEFNRVLHETCLIIAVVNENVPHIRHVERETLDTLNYDDGIFYVECHVGFNDSQDIPKATQLAIDTFPELAHLKESDAMYFLSSQEVKRDTGKRRLASWRAMLFVAMARNQADARAVYHTPKERSVVLGADLYL